VVKIATSSVTVQHNNRTLSADALVLDKLIRNEDVETVDTARIQGVGNAEIYDG